mmetsp:Transcript_1143/g.4704  ORF Transcript_1143/g.4704 Transcript_1143/m.4704 type:complete len:252 (-) Transcript_1143:681-1436(-)
MVLVDALQQRPLAGADAPAGGVGGVPYGVLHRPRSLDRAHAVAARPRRGHRPRLARLHPRLDHPRVEFLVAIVLESLARVEQIRERRGSVKRSVLVRAEGVDGSPRGRASAADDRRARPRRRARGAGPRARARIDSVIRVAQLDVHVLLAPAQQSLRLFEHEGLVEAAVFGAVAPRVATHRAGRLRIRRRLLDVRNPAGEQHLALVLADPLPASRRPPVQHELFQRLFDLDNLGVDGNVLLALDLRVEGRL